MRPGSQGDSDEHSDQRTDGRIALAFCFHRRSAMRPGAHAPGNVIQARATGSASVRSCSRPASRRRYPAITAMMVVPMSTWLPLVAVHCTRYVLLVSLVTVTAPVAASIVAPELPLRT